MKTKRAFERKGRRIGWQVNVMANADNLDPGPSYGPGDKVTLVATSHRIEAGGKAIFLAFPRVATCTLRDTGDPDRPVDCFP